jgi:Kdo2-lipid IVA lauroyltransferase/acyltransferase
MKLISFYFFYFFSTVTGSLPFTVLYGISDFLAFVLHKIIGYRKAVIMDNLERSFPGMNKESRLKVISAFYRNLSDVILEGVKAFRMSEKQVLTRYKILNPGIVNPFLEAGRGVICVTGHYGNWEWGALSPPLQMPWKFAAFYKPMKDPRLDKFVRKNRSRFGTYLSPIRETTKTFEDNRGIPVIYLMAADQSPSNREAAYWADFLGRDTAFLHGPEKHARINNYPVVFAAIRRVKRGFYELDLSILADDPSALPDGEITRRYAKMMESLIMEDPANWLWSHKRWKLTR